MYESDALLEQYLAFHYEGDAPTYLPHHHPPPELLGYPRRCAELLLRHATRHGRALDLGCAVGGSSFVLAQSFDEVVGLDFSRRFIDAATGIARDGVFRTSEKDYRLPSDLRKTTPVFRQADACDLPPDLGTFDAVLLANLLCRLSDPAACLRGLRRVTAPGAVMVITTPCSWDAAFTPPEKWLVPTLDALGEQLQPWCDRIDVLDLPFLLRDHPRRAQFTIAQASVWRVKSHFFLQSLTFGFDNHSRLSQ